MSKYKQKDFKERTLKKTKMLCGNRTRLFCTIVKKSIKQLQNIGIFFLKIIKKNHVYTLHIYIAAN